MKIKADDKLLNLESDSPKLDCVSLSHLALISFGRQIVFILNYLPYPISMVFKWIVIQWFCMVHPILTLFVHKTNQRLVFVLVIDIWYDLFYFEVSAWYHTLSKIEWLTAASSFECLSCHYSGFVVVETVRVSIPNESFDAHS